MTAVAATAPTGLAKLREPFPANQISKLPKPTKAQTEAVKADYKAGVRCDICGTWHHPKVVHLDYVGHAALTDRLLDADPLWTWEPMATAPDGAPGRDQTGGMWIRLTVCGVTRIGYGSADGKSGGDAIKEIIGDALRNAAMRFGAALDLWHKGDLHADDEAAVEPVAPAKAAAPALISEDQHAMIMTMAEKGGIDLRKFCETAKIIAVNKLQASRFDGCMAWMEGQINAKGKPPPPAEQPPILDDEIPY